MNTLVNNTLDFLNRLLSKSEDKVKLILLNDDGFSGFLAMEILVKVIKCNPLEAKSIVLTAHKQGKCVIGTYADSEASQLKVELESKGLLVEIE